MIVVNIDRKMWRRFVAAAAAGEGQLQVYRMFLQSTVKDEKQLLQNCVSFIFTGGADCKRNRVKCTPKTSLHAL
jgi:hypothetical protein